MIGLLLAKMKPEDVYWPDISGRKLETERHPRACQKFIIEIFSENNIKKYPDIKKYRDIPYILRKTRINEKTDVKFALFSLLI